MTGLVIKIAMFGFLQVATVLASMVGLVLGSADTSLAALIVAIAVLIGSFFTFRQGARYNYASAMSQRIAVLEAEVDDWKSKYAECTTLRTAAESRARDYEERWMKLLTTQGGSQ